MKICFICTDPGVPVFGRKGCSTHVRETILTLLDAGHDVRLVCSNMEGDEGGRERIEIAWVAPYRSRKLGFDLRHLLLDRKIEQKAEEIARDWKPDAIYERYSLYSRAGTKLARRWNLPHLLEINAFLTREQKGRIRIGPLARHFELKIIRAARHIAVVSEPLREEVARIRKSDANISKMPMAVNLERFNPAIDGGPVRRQLGLEGRFIIGYVGTLTGWHGISLLYGLADRLRANGMPPFAILVVGGDEKRLAMHRAKVKEKGLEDCLRFHGPVAHSEVPGFIRAMDVALIPDTTYWSSPAKLFEYQGCGVPVMAPRYPSIQEAMRHGIEGMIFTPGDVDEMARHAVAMHKDSAARIEMGRQARARAAEFHSWDQLGQDVVRIFREQEEQLRAGPRAPGAAPVSSGAGR